jgi:iron complex outermembrane receptor protein
MLAIGLDMPRIAQRARRARPVLLALAAILSATRVLAQAPTPAPAPEAPAPAPAPAPDAPAPAPAPEAPAPEAPAPAPTPTPTPPQLVTSPPPVYPESELASGRHPSVVLKVTVFADGSLGDIAVEHSAGPAFDDAAVAAVKTWTFAPARRGDEPIASRVGVAVHFDLPELAQHEVAAVSETPAQPHEHTEGSPAVRAPAAAQPPAEPALPEAALPELGAHAHAHGGLRTEGRGAADVRLGGEILHAAPAQDSGELLARAPGMVVARIEGEAVAQRIMLRGFDADHGQDVELTVGGVPVNQPSHIHGQGYADLGFVIPETVRTLRVTEGVYDPRQGDFAVAGSADFELGVEQRGIRLSSGYGSFRTFRELAVYAPEGQDPATFGAVVFKKTDGFGDHRAAMSGAAVGQFALGSGSLRTTLHASVYGSRGQTANVVRRDDVAAGRVDFHGVYPLATAEAQSASAQRAQLSTHTHYHGERGENGELVAFWIANVFRLQANYTGFTEVSRHDPSWTGRGDLIEQRNDDRTLGLRGRYRTPEQRPWPFLRGFFEIGVSGRLDRIEQSQDLIQAPENATWDQRIDASIDGLDIGGYVDLDTTWFERLHLRGGVRADMLSYQVADRLANLTPAFREEDHIQGYRRSAAGIAVGPRAVVELEVLPVLSVIGAYGEGYRSPMALVLDDGETAPFVKVRSGDVGVKVDWGKHDELELRASGYATHLADDVAFDPREGRVEPVGPTLRLGAVLYAVARPLDWLLFAGSATYVHATLEEPPTGTADDPDPAFHDGQLLPYVPPVVLRADLSAHHRLLDIGGKPLRGRAGAGFSYWAPRPLPFSQRAASVSLLDAEVALSYTAFTGTLSCFNVLDRQYAAMELSYASNWNPEGFPSRIPARHIMAGSPRSFFATLEVSW